ncbi:MAG: eukaryotic-like serine/threonine-protein kinase [Chthoniobacter sp.]|jgi:serine/threonine protein kinase|nr:eukaryotic-like serine/threonine-protein kinase [Chthoniobacter sp.]
MGDGADKLRCVGDGFVAIIRQQVAIGLSAMKPTSALVAPPISIKRMDLPPSSPQEEAEPPLDTEPATKPAVKILFGRYRVIEELGRGGMGRVVLAEDTVLGVEVAVKILPDAVASDANAVADLRKEVLRGRALTNPGIVRVHTLEQDASGVGIVMEYVEGETLSQIKARQFTGCFDCEDLLPWIEQLCPILDYAHRDARIVHRDLKPNNLLVTGPARGFPKGCIKVADFGLATTLSESVSRHSREGTASGTPPYMSPQQALGQRPTHLDDLYSLGVTIFDLLTGKPPFFRGDIAAQIRELVPPTMANRRIELGVCHQSPIPAAWEEAVAACLAKDPALRPQSAAELLDWLRGKRAVPEKKSEPEKKVSAPAWKWFVVAAAVAGVTLIVFLFMKVRPDGNADAGLPSSLIAELKRASATEPFVNSVGLKLAPVPITGGPSDAATSGATVLFATTETTEGLYQRFVAARPRPRPAPDFAQDSDHPAVNVSWEDAVAFCEWLTEIERAAGRLPDGARYRLPSDHEWSCAVGIGAQEDAAKTPKEKRGAITGVFPWGSAWPPPPRAGNYADASAKKAGVGTAHLEGFDDGFARTSPGETFPANALGLHGLGDNVSEWCDDWYDPAKKEERTLRGASWADADELYLLSSFRGAYNPTQRFTAYGFRCVLEVKAAGR